MEKLFYEKRKVKVLSGEWNGEERKYWVRREERGGPLRREWLEIYSPSGF